MPSLLQVLELVLEISLVLGFIGLVFFQPLYRLYAQSRNWKEISSEFGLQLDFHLMYPEMKGQVGGRPILFQNSVNWVRSPWSRLQIWIPFDIETPVRFFIYQDWNNSYRPPTLNKIEGKPSPLDFLGERFMLEAGSADTRLIPLKNEHLVRLFRNCRYIGLAVDGRTLFYERNDISYSAEDLRSTINELILLANTLNGAKEAPSGII
jgi:hypothetical protein